MKILAAIDFGGELDKIAMRGARYGMPGFESSEELKSGQTKRTYLSGRDALEQARAFVENAGKNPGDLAGRLVALAVMARYADEHAVAQSARSYATVDRGRALPWSDETVELLDEIAAELLPAHIREPGREQREAEAELRQAILADRQWLAQTVDALEDMDTDARKIALENAEERFGEYSAPTWELRNRVRELNAVDEAGDPPAERGEGSDA